MIEKTLIVLCIAEFFCIICSSALFFRIGKIVGTKEGIDYCFDQREKELLQKNDRK